MYHLDAAAVHHLTAVCRDLISAGAKEESCCRSRVDSAAAADSEQCAAACRHSAAVVGGEKSKIGTKEGGNEHEEGKNVKKWDVSGGRWVVVCFGF